MFEEGSISTYYYIQADKKKKYYENNYYSTNYFLLTSKNKFNNIFEKDLENKKYYI